MITAVIGITLLCDALAHIVLALTLPTGAYLAVSRAVNWAILGSAAAYIWLTRRRVEGVGREADKND
jgi:hypothetical protein